MRTGTIQYAQAAQCGGCSRLQPVRKGRAVVHGSAWWDAQCRDLQWWGSWWLWSGGWWGLWCGAVGAVVRRGARDGVGYTKSAVPGSPLGAGVLQPWPPAVPQAGPRAGPQAGPCRSQHCAGRGMGDSAGLEPAQWVLWAPTPLTDHAKAARHRCLHRPGPDHGGCGPNRDPLRGPTTAGHSGAQPAGGGGPCGQSDVCALIAVCRQNPLSRPAHHPLTRSDQGPDHDGSQECARGGWAGR